MNLEPLQATCATTKQVRRKGQERGDTNQVQRRERRWRRSKSSTGVGQGGRITEGRWFGFCQRGGKWLVMAASQRAAYKQRDESAWYAFLPPSSHKPLPLPPSHSSAGKQLSSLNESERGSRTVSPRDTGRVWSRKWMYSGSGAWLFGEMNHYVLWSPLHWQLTLHRPKFGVPSCT